SFNSAMVAVVEALPECVPRYDDVGPVEAQETNDLPAQVGIVGREAVGIAEQDALADAEEPARGALLLLADGCELLRVHLGVVRSLVATGHYDVGDIPALRAPLRDSAAAEE